MTLNWDWNYAFQIMPDLLQGLLQTLLITAACSVLALVGGLLIAIISSTARMPGRLLVRIIIELFRGIPILVLLYLGFYALPSLGITLPAYVVGIFVLGVVYAAYCSEVYRGGFLSIPSGTHDACTALGLPRPVAWVKVLIPLAIRASLPALLNYILILYKQTALLFAIGVPVLLTRAQVAGYEEFRYLEPYTIAGIIYLAINAPFVILLRRLGDKNVTTS